VIIMSKVFITGGLGFIGSNIAHDCLNGTDHDVVIFDNFSRQGVEKNAEWLRANPNADRLKIIKGDVAKDFNLLKNAMQDAEIIYHAAGQVAVTLAIKDPRLDFETNVIGTFNVLEAARLSNANPIMLQTSTNKVYGDCALDSSGNLQVVEKEDRYEFNETEGIDENYPLDPKGIYGSSKAAGDSYWLDYAHVYGMKTITFRMSCIYGPRQMATSDQGWIAWMILCNVFGLPFTVHGNGKQVRDILYISDLIRAFNAAIDNISTSRGKPYNIGGGPKNAISLINCMALIEKFSGKKTKKIFDKWRQDDQKIYISNIDKIKKDLGWIPLISKDIGVHKMHEWIIANQNLYSYLRKKEKTS